MSPRRSASSIRSASCATKNVLQRIVNMPQRSSVSTAIVIFTNLRRSLPFLRWLYSRAWVSAERPSVLFDLATAWLAEQKILLPGVTVLARLVARVRDRAAHRLWKTLAQLPEAAQRERLETLLVVPEGARQTPFDRLRRGPTRVSGPGLLERITTAGRDSCTGRGRLDLPRIPPGRLKALARFAAATGAPSIWDGCLPDSQIATLLAFARHFEMVALDEALDVLDALLTT